MEAIRNFFLSIGRFLGFVSEEPKPDGGENGPVSGGNGGPVPISPDPAPEPITREYDDLEALIEAISAAWGSLPSVLTEQEWAAFKQEVLAVMKEEADAATDSDLTNDAAVIAKVTTILKRYPAAHAEVDKYYDRFVSSAVIDSGGTLSEEAAEAVIQETSAAEESAVLEEVEDKNDDIDITVYFATDREYDRTGYLAQKFLNKAGDGDLKFGVATVSIPDNHVRGNLESPKRWRFQKFDPQKHFTVLTLDLLRKDDFQSQVSDEVKAGNGEALVFIHGYNVSFQGGLRRTAQVAYDLNFEGVPIFYSWPSHVKTLKYWADEKTIEWSQPHFDEFIKFVLSDLGATRVHVIAHSMGNRLLSNGMANLKTDGLPAHAAQLRQVMFTAPDVDAKNFEKLAEAFHGKADRFTLYASSSDFPLELSSVLHGGNRAGEVDGEPTIVSPVETIDVTSVDTVLSGLGHSYYGDNLRVMNDMLALVQKNTDPKNREGLFPKEIEGDDYWAFKR